MPDLTPITPSAIRQLRVRTVAHLNMGRVHVLNKEAVDFPGLVVSDAWDKKARRSTRTFFVQGDPAEYETLEAAAKAWNDRFIRGSAAA